MKRILIFAAGLGLLLGIAVIAYQGFGAVAHSFADIGWGIAIVILLRIIQLTLAGVAWWCLFPPNSGCAVQMCILVRWLREAINALLPVALVGGDILGARLLTFFGVAGGLSGASVLIDMLIQTGTQVIYSLVAVGILVTLGGNETLVFWSAIGLAVMSLALIAFFALQRFGGVGLAEKAVMKIAEKLGWSSLGHGINLNDNLQLLHSNVWRFALASVIHLGVWFIGAIEILVGARCMGYQIGYSDALVIESLGQAIRAAAFLIPGALGVQEGGYIALCAVFGVPPPAALALSLVKRVPDLVLGLPGLVVWQALEGRALLHATKGVANE